MSLTQQLHEGNRQVQKGTVIAALINGPTHDVGAALYFPPGYAALTYGTSVAIFVTSTIRVGCRPGSFNELDDRRNTVGAGDDFKNFCGRLVINNRDDLLQRYHLIVRRLNADFRGVDSKTAHSLCTGSYGRGTAIRGCNDLDMIFCLPDESYERYASLKPNGQFTLLLDVQTSLQKTLSNARIGANGQAVIVSYPDGVAFEIVPAFLNRDGSYTCPDANLGGSWKTTNPKAEIEAIAAMSAQTNGNLKWLCRMMRAWKNLWSAPMGGLQLDTLAYNFIKDWRYKEKTVLYYDWMCRDFLKYLSERPERDTMTTAGSNQYIWSQGRFQHVAVRSLKLADEAIQFSSSGYDGFAQEKWRQVFGAAFPLETATAQKKGFVCKVAA